MQNIDQQLKSILNGIQLGIYCILSLISIFKLVNAIQHRQSFLIKFYTSVMLITFLEIAIQSLEIAYNNHDLELSIYSFLIINLYAILMQSLAIFLLSDYWYQTREILTKSSNEVELDEDKHPLRYSILITWTILYSIFVGYGLGTSSFNSNIFRQVLALGCQGIGVIIIIWALVLQVNRGYTLKTSIKKYKEWVSSVLIKTIQFQCLYYISTILNIFRICYLIAITIIVDIYKQQQEWLYIFSYIYTATNIVVILVYLFGFALNHKQDDKNETLLSTNKQSANPNDQLEENRKRKQTQLSSSSGYNRSDKG